MISPIYTMAHKGALKIIRPIIEECVKGKYTLVDKQEDTWKGKYDLKTSFPPCGGSRFRDYTLVLDKQEKTVANIEFSPVGIVNVESLDKSFDSLEKLLKKSLKFAPQPLSKLVPDWHISKSEDKMYEIGKLYFQKQGGK